VRGDKAGSHFSRIIAVPMALYGPCARISATHLIRGRDRERSANALRSSTRLFKWHGRAPRRHRFQAQIGAGSFSRIAEATSVGSAGNACCPVNISYSTAPNGKNVVRHRVLLILPATATCLELARRCALRASLVTASPQPVSVAAAERPAGLASPKSSTSRAVAAA